MPKLFSPGIVGNGFLWIVALAMQIGGWENQVVAAGLLVIALLWSAAAATYWLAIRKHPRLGQFGELAIFGDSSSPDIMTVGPIPSWKFYTRDAKNRTVGDQRKDGKKIQSIRFTKPVEMMINENQLPKAINLEPKSWKRLSYFFLGIPQPRIVVKKFFGKEILFDEESTGTRDVNVEIYLAE